MRAVELVQTEFSHFYMWKKKNKYMYEGPNDVLGLKVNMKNMILYMCIVYVVPKYLINPKDIQIKSLFQYSPLCRNCKK